MFLKVVIPRLMMWQWFLLTIFLPSFSNGSTTDDHAIHLIGYKEADDGWWFLIKDSASGSRNGKHAGYYFYHEDYVKLKMMSFTIHKDAVADLLKRF